MAVEEFTVRIIRIPRDDLIEAILDFFGTVIADIDSVTYDSSDDEIVFTIKEVPVP